ncbi:hypothetical protein [Afifella pfennigii]|uniref:hypothetical protein n=1 Tax=Afifella pfennigii TaxID=209897 RepID=UPI00047BD477|nr:hypothetical protein [Afifella pfennigii]
MLSKVLAVLALVPLLCGFTVDDALQRFNGSWQADDPTHGFAGAILFDASERTITAAAYSEKVQGTIESITVMGTSAIVTVSDETIVLYSGKDPDVIKAQIAHTPTIRFVRVR